MTSSTLGARLGSAVAVTLLLTLVAACSSDDPGPEATAAPSPTAAATSGSATPVPDPTPTTRTNTLPPPATTPVPPPTPGSVDSTVAPKPEVSKKPVKLDKPSRTGTGLTAKLVSIKAITAKAQLPGEVAGPALAVTVDVTNTGSKSADLSAVVVTLLDADEAPGSEMTLKPADPLAGKVTAGRTARGVYVFTVPKKKRSPITVTVSFKDAPVLAFTGDAD